MFLQTTLADIPYLGLLLTIIGLLFGVLIWVLSGILNTLKTRFTTLEADMVTVKGRQDTFELKLEMFNRDLMIKDLEKQNKELVERLKTKPNNGN